VKQELPHSIEHEQQLLSAMMMKKGEIVPAIAEQLSAEDFYRPEHRLIYNAILSAYEKTKPLDQTFVLDELKQSGTLEKVTAKYFLSVIGASVTTAYVSAHIEVIKELAVKRRIIDMADGLKEQAYSPAVSVDTLMSTVEGFLVKSDDNTQSSFETSGVVAAQLYERAQELRTSKGLTGIPTGLWDLNELTNGLQRGELILLAARPSMGKTALALNIAQGAANRGKVVAMFSLEMGKRQIGNRLLALVSGVEVKRIATGKGLTDKDNSCLVDAIEDMDNHPVFIDDTSGLDVGAMRMKLRRFKQVHGLDLIVVDYLQLMRGRGENRVQEISEISRGLKSLAKEFDVPVLALSQLSRNVEMRAEKRPQLSDLRDSGSLEQDADIVMFLYREDYYDAESDDAGTAQLIIAKNRNGATATITLYFCKETMTFGDFVNEPPN